MFPARVAREMPHRYRLEAAKCKKCGAVFFPHRLICRECGHREFDTINISAIGKLISICLRSGVDVESVIGRLRGIRCPSIAWDGGHAVLSCADAIAGVLERRSRGEDGGPEPGGKTYEAYQLALSAPTRNVAGQCPDCSGLLVYAEGCYVCRFCGYTKCG